MSGDAKTDSELEIAHVLFIDTVGYSNLSIQEQRELLTELNQVVRDSSRFKAAESAGKLIRLPTGDGMALIFSDSPESPLQCAVEIAGSLRDHPRVKVRMGIHSGPVSRVVDVNDQSNAAGAGINIAERVMSCADAGHILLSKRAAQDLVEYSHWQPFLTDLGECEVKHGKKVGLVNFYNNEVGNPKIPGALQRRASEQKKAERALLWRKLAATTVIIAICIAVVAALLLKNVLFNKNSYPRIPFKSIAVLPFENLTDDKQNAYLADGITDEILTNLAKVADLKVISRTSVMQYRVGIPRNLRDIGVSLGVAHVLEGTVQRLGEHLRVNARLIDAKSGTHLWAQSYDRQVANIFTIESDLAEDIVTQLRSQLSPEEKASIESVPTNNPVAYELYLRARAISSTAAFGVREKEKLLQTADLLQQAIQRDPDFFLAYCHLARTHDRIYILGIDHTAARLELADAAIKKALALRPNAGEARLALATHLYTLLDYDGARQELAAAGRALPNEPLVFELTGYIDRRQGRWDECLRNLQRALELDPRNFLILQQISLACENMRRFPEMIASLDKALLIVPDDTPTRMQRALAELDWRADPKPLRAAVESAVAQDPGSAAGIAQFWLYLALCERDTAAAGRALAVMTSDGCRNEGIPLPKAWCEGVAARARGDNASAQAAFKTARTEIENSLRDQPDYPAAHCVLGMVDAGLGVKEQAVREGQRAVELLPVSKDAINGALMVEYLALIYAWTGDKDHAFQQLEIVAKIPCDVNYGQLRLHPYWDPLRNDPRFEKIVQSLAPK